MSYCRFSSDDFQCDAYCYENCFGGWTIHVSAYRVAFREPLPTKVEMTAETLEEWWARHKRVQEILDASPRERIRLPGAGETFYESSPGAAADRLESLRAAGFRVPQSAIDALRAEQQEMSDDLR